VTASSLVRRARTASGHTQKQIARVVGIDQSSISRIERGRDADFNTITRIVNATGYQLVALPTRRADVATMVSNIARDLKANDKQRAIRDLIQLNDNLVAERGLIRGVLAVAEPESTGNPLWDATIAAIVEWRLTEDHVPLPQWVGDSSRTLSTPTVLRLDPADPDPTIADVPKEFIKHGVLAWRDTFESV